MKHYIIAYLKTTDEFEKLDLPALMFQDYRDDAGIWRKRIPIILSPSRSVASPYMWKILGERYPIICFSTCPYSCKAPKPEVSLIKRRKRTFVASKN